VSSAGRWELLRALGAVAGDPADARKVLATLGLDGAGLTNAEHTEVFVLNCPPYASVYLGAEGGLGGEAADRVAGFYRAIGLEPAASEPDHLTVLLSLYAALGEDRSSVSAAITTQTDKRSWNHVRQVLFWEHLWPWLPGYLGAVTDVGVPTLSAWAELTMQVLVAEQAAMLADAQLPAAQLPAAQLPAAQLPLALREAPPPLTGDESLGELLDALTAPIRSGMILTRRTLAIGAGQAGAGHRIGERRFTLRAMLEQEPERTFGWLADEAERWSARHAACALGDPVHHWWAERAFTTATVLKPSVALTP
jgi:TorA maturation chaperone TorD